MPDDMFRRPQHGGWIVRQKTGRRGPGKVIGTNAEEVLVEYFHSPGRQTRELLRRDSLVKVPLERETRCYLFSEESQRWHIGRLTEQYDHDYQIDLPDGRSVYVPEAAIYVRCHDVADPIETLLVRGHETAFYYKHRLGFRRSLIKQRAAIGGLTALASASIELYPHQVEIVRRVLEDPIQRYLLADEVGLGKTIEAATLLRQFLLDEPLGRGVVAAPATLIAQWEEELRDRFHLNVCEQVTVVDVARLPEVEVRSLGMVVIDEAHHVAADAFASDPQARDRFRQIAVVAHQTQRLLLLSATPAANNEKAFLAMLHLLDPATYPLDALDQFEQRVHHRQAVGRLLNALHEDDDPFAVGLTAEQLKRTFPDDMTLVALLRDLESSLRDGDSNTTAATVRHIRAHISESYRIHRRMLRSRRADASGVLSSRAEADAAIPKKLTVSEPWQQEAHELIDDWRAYAADSIPFDIRTAEGDLHEREAATVLLLQLLLDAAATSPARLGAVVRARLGQPVRDHAALSPEHLVVATSVPQYEGERQALQRMLLIAERHADARERDEALARHLREIRERVGIAMPPRCVVFTPDAEEAHHVAHVLARHFGRRAVATMTVPSRQDQRQAADDEARYGVRSEQTTTHTPDALSQFRTEWDCFVLVCDPSAEEGLNLQHADYVVLYNVPWSPSRLEQRLGRLDRIGRVRGICPIVFAPGAGADTIWDAWTDVLRDGLRIFHESVAGLQFFLQGAQSRMERAMLYGGAPELRQCSEPLRIAADKERRRAREQNVLDEIEGNIDQAASFFRNFDDLDAEAERLRTAFDGWACTILGLQRLPTRDARVARYGVTKHTKVPNSILRMCVSPHLGRPCTFERAAVVDDPKTALVRVGHGLMDGLTEYLDWDDRGATYAIWRREPAWDPAMPDVWTGFRLDYVVESDVAELKRHLAEAGLPPHAWRALARRADAALAPYLVSLYLDADGHEVLNERLLTVLKRPFRKAVEGGSDWNLHKANLAVLDELLSHDHWTAACRLVRHRSEDMLRKHVSFTSRVRNAAAVVERRYSIEDAQQRARKAAAAKSILGVATEADNRVEEVCRRALLAAVSHPAVRLDGVGFMAVSKRAHPRLTDVE